MRVLAIKEEAIIKPPYRADIPHIVNWLSGVGCVCTGKSGRVNGLLSSKNLVLTTAHIQDDLIKINTPEGRIDADRIYLHDVDAFISAYKLRKDVAFVGMPTRTDKLQEGSFLFSVNFSLDVVKMWSPIGTAKSKTYAKNDEEGQLEVEKATMQTTPIICDRFGYFIGIGVGSYQEEVIVQILNLVESKL